MPAVWIPVSWLKTLWPMMGSRRPHGQPAALLDLAPQGPEHVVAEAGDGHPVQLLQDHHRGVERRVARTLPEPVHGAGGDGGAVVERAHGVVGGETEVVVEMDDQRLRGKSGHELRDVVVDALGREEAHGVGERVARAPRLVAGVGQRDQVVDVGPGAVLPPELDLGDPPAARVGDGPAGHPDVGFPVEGDGQVQPFLRLAPLETEERLPDLVLEVQVGAGREDEERAVVGPGAHLLQRVEGDVDVPDVRAAHHDDLEVGTDAALLLPFEDQLQGPPLGGGGGGEAHVEDVQARVREQAGHLVLLLGGEGDARRLLAVPECRVVEPDLLGPRERGFRREAGGRGDQRVQGLAGIDHRGGTSFPSLADHSSFPSPSPAGRVPPWTPSPSAPSPTMTPFSATSRALREELEANFFERMRASGITFGGPRLLLVPPAQPRLRRRLRADPRRVPRHLPRGREGRPARSAPACGTSWTSPRKSASWWRSIPASAAPPRRPAWTPSSPPPPTSSWS